MYLIFSDNYSIRGTTDAKRFVMEHEPIKIFNNMCDLLNWLDGKDKNDYHIFVEMK